MTVVIVIAVIVIIPYKHRVLSVVSKVLSYSIPCIFTTLEKE